MSDIREGDITLMSGMYSTVVDMINKAHPDDLFTFEKRDDIEGLANITLPMIVSSITDDNVTFELVPFLNPLIPTGNITLSKKQIVNMEPYIKIYKE